MVLKRKQKKKNREQLIAGLTEISPGVLASPGALKDPAMKKVLEKLKGDPSSLDSSGFKDRYNWKGDKVKRKRKRKTKTA